MCVRATQLLAAGSGSYGKGGARGEPAALHGARARAFAPHASAARSTLQVTPSGAAQGHCAFICIVRATGADFSKAEEMQAVALLRA